MDVSVLPRIRSLSRLWHDVGWAYEIFIFLHRILDGPVKCIEIQRNLLRTHIYPHPSNASPAAFALATSRPVATMHAGPHRDLEFLRFLSGLLRVKSKIT